MSIAVLTIAIFFYADYIRVPKVSNSIPLEKDFRIMTIFYLNVIKNWILIFYFSSALVFLSFYIRIWEYKYVPKFVEGFMITLFGYISVAPF